MPHNERQPHSRNDRREAPREDPARTAHHDAIYALARASEVHDAHTGDHVLRIRLVVERVAIHLGMDELDAEALGYDAMLHDVGKLLVPPEILRKPTLLDDREREVMEAHTLHGERLLADRPSLQRAARIARSHHERHDGRGYPDGLAGDQVPLEARITAAADVLDALMSERPYKPAWTFIAAMEHMQSLAGTQLDPEVVAALRAAAGEGLGEVWGAEGTK